MLRYSLIDRYIGWTMARATGMTVLVLTILLVFFGFVDEMEDVGEGDYQVDDAFIVAALSSPRYVFEVFPISALLGSLIGLGGMAAHGELIAIRAAGLSLHDIVLSVVKTGLLLMVAVFLFGEFVAPPAEQLAQQISTEKQQGKVTLKTRYGFWARDGQAFVNIRSILAGTRLEDIYIYEFDERQHMKLATHAAVAEYQGDHWQLRDIEQSSFEDGRVSARQLSEARWDSLLDPGLLSVVIVKPDMLTIPELNQYVNFMRRNGQSALDYEVAFWNKITTPLATAVMLFLAIPFVLGSQRSSGTGQRVFLGAMLGAVFYMSTRAMSFAAVVYEMNALVAAAVPGIAFMIVAMLLLRRVH